MFFIIFFIDFVHFFIYLYHREKHVIIIIIINIIYYAYTKGPVNKHQRTTSIWENNEHVQDIICRCPVNNACMWHFGENDYLIQLYGCSIPDGKTFLSDTLSVIKRM